MAWEAIVDAKRTVSRLQQELASREQYLAERSKVKDEVISTPGSDANWIIGQVAETERTVNETRAHLAYWIDRHAKLVRGEDPGPVKDDHIPF